MRPRLPPQTSGGHVHRGAREDRVCGLWERCDHGVTNQRAQDQTSQVDRGGITFIKENGGGRMPVYSKEAAENRQ